MQTSHRSNTERMAKRILFTVLLGLMSTGAFAQLAPSDADDHALVTRFLGAEIVDYRTPGISNYRLALDRMQRVNGQVSAGKEERIRGTLTRITYRIPDGYPGADVFEHYSEQLLAAGSELFRCQGRGCGSSNFWANDVFENRILYGPEAEQFYMASSVTNANASISAYIALYVVTRGNRSVYAHLDILELNELQSTAPSTTPEALALQIQQEGGAQLNGVSFNSQDQLSDEGGLNLLRDTLINEPLLQVYIVSHLSGEQSLAQLQERSQRRAQTIVDALVAMQIDASRLSAQGVGPLAPVCRQAPCAQRIEVVAQP